jgi:hypothetical protein
MSVLNLVQQIRGCFFKVISVSEETQNFISLRSPEGMFFRKVLDHLLYVSDVFIFVALHQYLEEIGKAFLSDHRLNYVLDF